MITNLKAKVKRTRHVCNLIVHREVKNMYYETIDKDACFVTIKIHYCAVCGRVRNIEHDQEQN